MYRTYKHSHRNLIAWQTGKKLVLKVYSSLKDFPKEEMYGLSSQMKRAAVSVVSNIAEGGQKKTINDRKRFYNIAQGSLTELDCQLEIALELEFISESQYKECLELLNKTAYLLTKLILNQPKINPFAT